MIELLRAAAAEAPERVALARASGEVTYGDLVARAETAAAALRARGIDRVSVLDPDHATVWTLLAACSLAGVESCLYPVAATDDTVAELRERLRHDVLITPRDLPEVLRPDELLAGPDRLADGVPESRPLLVLTSGTTSGRPRAARHDWSRILRVARRIRPTPEQRWLLAYAPNQFAGLQMLLHAAAARCTLVAGESFQPRDGLEAMRRFAVTHASGTPTFWRFLLAELRTDGGAVPDLEQVTLGGEAVPSPVVAALRTTFPRAKVSQLYAATEMGLSVSVRDGEIGLPVSVLDDTDGEAQFKVVDGELWVRSRSGMLGYFDEEPVPDDGWRASGDLVEVVGDRILFRGRATEVINVGGVKVHPLPLEERASRVPGVALVHAHGRPNALVGQVVALDVVLEAGADRETVDRAIREEFADDPAAHRPRSITFVENLDISGGKLARKGAQ